jgi:hypothetical protein
MEGTMDRLQRLEARIRTIKGEIAALGDLRPGSLSQQYNVCGTPGCRCKADPPQRHGPYGQLSFTWRGRSRSVFVRKQHLPSVEAQLENYARLRELVERWIDLGIELCRLRLERGVPTASKASHARPGRQAERRARRRTAPAGATDQGR